MAFFTWYTLLKSSLVNCTLTLHITHFLCDIYYIYIYMYLLFTHYILYCQIIIKDSVFLIVSVYNILHAQYIVVVVTHTT